MNSNDEMPAVSERSALRWIKPLLLLLLVLSSLPYYLRAIDVLHDTSHLYRIYNYFYSELVSTGEIPSWFPNSGFGMEAYSAFMLYISPPLALMAAIGYLLGVHDVMFLFTTGMLLNQVILLTGTLLLARLLFKRIVTVLFVVVTVVTSTLFLQQYHLGLAVYMYWPLELYLIIVAFRDARLSYLISAGVVLLLSQFGKPLYLIPLDSLFLGTFTFAFILLRRADLRRMMESLSRDKWRILLSLSLLLGLAAMIFLYVKRLDGEFVVTAPGRNLDGKVSREVFLAWGNLSGWRSLGWLIQPKEMDVNIPYSFDFSVFTGYLALFFAACGILLNRGPAKTALLASFVALSLLAAGAGTPFAGFLYDYFPLMEYLRNLHIALVGAKVIVPILAGFGIESLIEWIETARNRKWAVRAGCLVLGAIFLAASFVYTTKIQLASKLYSTLHPTPETIARASALVTAGRAYLIVSAAFLCAALIVSRACAAKRSVETVLLASAVYLGISYLLIIHLILTPAAYFQNTPYVRAVATSIESGEEPPQEAFDRALRAMPKTRPHPFNQTRAISPYTAAAADLAVINFLGATYGTDYDYVSFDTCAPFLYPDERRFWKGQFNSLNPSVHALLYVAGYKAMGIRLAFSPWDSTTPSFLRVFACGGPKIFIADRVEHKRMDEVTRDDLLRDAVIISGGSPGEASSEGASGTGPRASGTVEVGSFSANGLSLRASVPQPSGWLVYADAWSRLWHATVDGEQAPIEHANIAFKAVRVPGGEHTVSFRYGDAVLNVLRAVFVAIEIAVMLGVVLLFFKVDLAAGPKPLE